MKSTARRWSEIKPLLIISFYSEINNRKAYKFSRDIYLSVDDTFFAFLSECRQAEILSV